EEESARLTFADLDRQAPPVAVALWGGGGQGGRALPVYAPGLDFIPAFFGCLYAGVVPVPAYPPRLDRLVQSWQILSGITVDCEPKVVLTTRNLAAMFGGTAAVPPLAALSWICTDGLDFARAEQWRQPSI